MSKFSVKEFIAAKDTKKYLLKLKKAELVQVCATYSIEPEDGYDKKDYIEALLESKGKFTIASVQAPKKVKITPVKGKRI